MNVPKVLMSAILRQLATTLKEVSPVLVTLGSQAMDPFAQVNAAINLLLQIINNLCTITRRAVKNIIYILIFSSNFYDFSLQI